ncbi:MAG: hypothetical protein EXR98_07325 [Gemmataceae bacterium]|nr:hypothetical protein [Gemmataceae bacterium]
MADALAANPRTFSSFFQPFDAALTEYRNGLTIVQARIVDVLEKADEIIALANEAAGKSQGEKFRILGIDVDLGELNARLESISDELETRRAALANLNLQPVGNVAVGPLHVPIRDSTIAWIVEEQDLLAGRVTSASAVYDLHIDDDIPSDIAIEDQIEIAYLNGIFDYLADMESDVISQHEGALDDAIDMVAEHPSISQQNPDWQVYLQTAQSNFAIKVQQNIAWIAPEDDDAGSAIHKLGDAWGIMDNSGDADYAGKGVKEYIRLFREYLVAEQATVVEEGDWVADNTAAGLAKTAALQNFLDLWNKLDDAITQLDSFLGA